MFERAAQVNARFAAGSCQPEDVIAALEKLGLTRQQITVLTRPTPTAAPAQSATAGFMQRLRGMFKEQQPVAVASAPDWQVIVHMGQDATLSEPVQAVFRQFGAAGIEHFGPTNTPNRAFGPASNDKPGVD